MMRWSRSAVGQMAATGPAQLLLLLLHSQMHIATHNAPHFSKLLHAMHRTPTTTLQSSGALIIQTAVGEDNLLYLMQRWSVLLCTALHQNENALVYQ